MAQSLRPSSFSRLLSSPSNTALRMWSSVEHGPNKHLPATQARLKYALSAAGIVDLVAVLPFWFAMILPGDLRVVLVFRMVRFFKFARYSPAMRSLLDVLYNERRALFGCLVISLGTALVAASLMHLVEGNVQPAKLGTIPDAFWWAIVTVGTIGYGDVVPVTPLGQADRDRHDLRRPRFDGASGRYHCNRLR